ncbi:aldehyde dehydrogenase family protein [Radiobacillus sp. PE A8.2]|uniref:aldehyde dehydrogenase family protein n=1 Tax=Radiobacillus sp. PE A8.2 TaxID=3380349 RepID=UPI00388F23E4
MNLTEKDIQTIIESVLKNVEAAIGNEAGAPSQTSSQQPLKMKQLSPEVSQTGASSHWTPTSEYGVFDNIEDAITASYDAQIAFVKQAKLADRERILSAIRTAVLKEKEHLAKLVFEETKIGNYNDKIAKHELSAEKTPGTEDLKTESITGDDGFTFVEYSPVGLIGAVTPVTNPTETIINNTISMLAAGNAVVFNVHPASKQASAYTVQLINRAIESVGGPANLVTMVKNPTLDTVQVLADSLKVKMLVGTGGPGMVKSLLKSGKKVIGAGAGNPPVIVDETADLQNAAKSIIEGASFDNNLLCIAEKEVFVLDSVADDLIFQLLDQGAHMLNHSELAQVMDFALEANTNNQPGGCTFQNRKYHVSKQWIGKDASTILNQINVNKTNTKLLICEVDVHHPFVQLEQMMPILPIVRVKDLDEAIEKAVATEHGNRHTAVMHSNNLDSITRFAKAIGTTIFVNNGSSLAGVGFGGEGHTTMTIAGPTGEGVTSAKTFTRQRRVVLAQGSLNITG